MNEREQLAAEYVLGVLEPDDRDRVESQATADSELKRLIGVWETRLAPLSTTIDPIVPPPDVFDAIERRLETSAAPPPGTQTIRASQGTWQTIATGLTMKLLRQDEDTGRTTMLLTIAPDTVYAGHAHDTAEEMYIVSGDLVFDDFELGPGDYHAALPGGTHPSAVSRTGCTALVISGA